MVTSAADHFADNAGALNALRHSQARPTIFPVAPEFTNWRSEQRSWRESVALLDQSHHMTDLFISGPDALKLLSDTGVNKFDNFSVNKAKQFIAVNYEGYIIGDAILFYLEENLLSLVGWHMVLDWVQFIGETGDYDVTFERDANSLMREPGKNPHYYRYELQGPQALKLMEHVTGAPVPDTSFFSMTNFTIAGVQVRSLRHGMAGQPGFELFGPWKDAEKVRDALIDAGTQCDLVLVGSKAYSSANLESGWVPSPLPGIFSGHRMEEYLAWLPSNRIGSIAGSYAPEKIEDYYLTPYDLGYGHVISFEHDFIGNEALQEHAQQDNRVKVTLVWDAEDVAAVQRSMYEPGLPAKFIELPKSRYGQYQLDRVEVDGKLVGVSHDVGYITNEQVFASLASMDAAYAEPGTLVTVVWGEEPNSRKPAVEKHRQVKLTATVQPVPYSSFARKNYRTN